MMAITVTPQDSDIPLTPFKGGIEAITPSHLTLQRYLLSGNCTSKSFV